MSLRKWPLLRTRLLQGHILHNILQHNYDNAGSESDFEELEGVPKNGYNFIWEPQMGVTKITRLLMENNMLSLWAPLAVVVEIAASLSRGPQHWLFQQNTGGSPLMSEGKLGMMFSEDSTSLQVIVRETWLQ